MHTTAFDIPNYQKKVGEGRSVQGASNGLKVQIFAKVPSYLFINTARCPKTLKSVFGQPLKVCKKQTKLNYDKNK